MVRSALWACLAAGMGLAGSAQNFYNLDFELATGIPPSPGYPASAPFSQAFPGWTGYCGTSQLGAVLYDYEWLDSAGIAIFDSNQINEPLAGVLQGEYCACLFSGTLYGTMNNYVATSIAQTGLIPAQATSLVFNFCRSSSWGSADVSVTFNGISIPVSVVSGGALSGDVSQFANQVGELRFTAPDESTPSRPIWRSIFLLDYIRFPGTPEPPDAPAIVGSPGSHTAAVGSTFDFVVSAAGLPPLAYQWFFDGTNSISSGTSRVLDLVNVQLSQAGFYSVVITNAFGAVTSSPAILTLLEPPQTQTAEAGSAVDLGVEARSPFPLFYWWYLNATHLISCGTNCDLQLTNVQFHQSGAYSVVVSNVLGATTSTPAMLSVIAPVEHRPVPGVKMTGQTGSLLNVDYANSLNRSANWATLGSVTLTSTSQYYFDLTLPLPPHRYYQAWPTGIPAVMPSLDLHLIPAITLTGNIGGSVRVDAINQFGPIDAWFTLDTVTLTNTSQLYFDVSAGRQPQRLYRLVPLP